MNKSERTSSSTDFCVQVRHTTGGRVRKREHLGRAECVRLQVVVQGPVVVVVCDEEELRPRTRSLNICCYKTWKKSKFPSYFHVNRKFSTR